MRRRLPTFLTSVAVPLPLRLALAVIALVYLVNFLALGFLVGPHDFDHLSSYYELAWRFWRSGEVFPGYNPYFCGGQTLAGNPQVPIYHPLVLLVPILGPTWTIKLELLAQLAAGLYGLDRILKRFGADDTQRAWGCLIFSAGGGVVARFLVGHVTLGFYLLYPLLLELSYRISDPDSRKPYPAYFALFLYCGLYKPNFLIYGVPPLFIEAFFRAMSAKTLRPVISIVVATLFCAAGGAISFLPAARYFTDFPRIDDIATKYIPPYAFFSNLLLPLKAIPKLFYGSGFLQRHEYNQFVGPIALALAWPGLKRLYQTLRPEAIGLVCMAFFSAWVGFGSTATHFQWHLPFTWFREVWPGFTSIRVPVRFWFSATLVVALLSPLGFRWPSDIGKRVALVLLGILPLVITAVINLSKPSYLAHETQWEAPREYPKARVWVWGSIHDMLTPIRRGEGVLACVYNLESNQSTDVKPGAQLAPDTSWQGWSEILVATNSRLGQRFTFNLNHSKYWAFEGNGAQVVSEPGDRLEIEALGPTIAGRLVFRQPAADLGAKVSLLTLAFALALWAGSYYFRQRRNRSGARA